MPEHEQVDFVTWDGKTVQVDRGMLKILSRMRDLGLKTQFSCQGGKHPAYVLMDRASGQRFEKILQNAELSELNRKTADRFLNGPRMHDFCLAIRNVEFWRWMITINPSLKIKPKRDRRYFEVERSYQLGPWWLRTTYRWPVKQNSYVLHMLDELVG